MHYPLDPAGWKQVDVRPCLGHIGQLLGLLGIATGPVNADAVMGKPAELLVQKGHSPCAGTSGIHYIAGQYHEIDRLGHRAVEHTLRGQIRGVDQYLSEVIGGFAQPADGPFQVKIAGMYEANRGMLHWLPPCTAVLGRKPRAVKATSAAAAVNRGWWPDAGVALPVLCFCRPLVLLFDLPSIRPDNNSRFEPAMIVDSKRRPDQLRTLGG